jgi:hypothetical protein
MSHLRLYTTEDYPMVCEWWRAWKWDCVPQEALPEIGVIASDDTQDICCAWMYKTDSKIALLEWFISNPKAKKGREDAIAAVTESIAEIAKRQGFTSLVTFTKHPQLTNQMERLGFSGRADHVSNLARSL